MSAEQDAELVGRFLRTRSPELFEKLVSKYVRLAGAVAYHVVGDYEAASDVVQEAFVKVYGSLGTLKEARKFKSWLYGVVRTTALDALRKNRRSPTSFGGLRGEERLVPDARGGDPAAALEDGERVSLIHREVQALPEGYREVVILKYLEGLSYQEIAEVTGLSVQAIESRLWRARNQLKKKFEGLSIR